MSSEDISRTRFGGHSLWAQATCKPRWPEPSSLAVINRGDVISSQQRAEQLLRSRPIAERNAIEGRKVAKLKAQLAYTPSAARV